MALVAGAPGLRRRRRAFPPGLLSALLALRVPGSAPADAGVVPDWSYRDPAKWAPTDPAALAENVAAMMAGAVADPTGGGSTNQCGLEGMQSPIGIGIGDAKPDESLKGLSFDEGSGLPVALVANLYTWKATWCGEEALPGAPSVVFAGTTYFLAQVHFHAPSEHAVNGKLFPMEAHLVHRTADGKNSLVVAVLLRLGVENAYLSLAWPLFPPNLTASQPAVLPPPYDRFLPVDRSYWYYVGSLTTPPCTTGIAWVVMQRPVSLSRRQLSDFRAGISSMTPNRLLVRMGTTPKGVVKATWNQELGMNSRPLQTLGVRVVASYAAPVRWGWVSLALIPVLGVLVLIALGLSLGCAGEDKSSGACDVRTLGPCADGRMWRGGEDEEEEEDEESRVPPLALPALSTAAPSGRGVEYQMVPQAE